MFVVPKGGRSRISASAEVICPLCSERLTGDRMVREHERARRDRGAFRCPCGKSSSCSEDLRRHSRSTGHFIPDTFRLAATDFTPAQAAAQPTTGDDSADDASSAGDWEIVMQAGSLDRAGWHIVQAQFEPPAPGTVEARQAQGNRLWCHVFLDKRHPEFDLVTKLIGESGRHMREIYQATYAELRVRGRGSGRLEVDGATEAPVPLMVAVTSEGVDQAHFRTAVEMTISRLKVVQGLFEQFCRQRALSESLTRTNLWRFGEMSKDAEIVLADLLPEGGKPQLARRAPMPAVVSQDSAVAEGQMAQDASTAETRGDRFQRDGEVDTLKGGYEGKAFGKGKGGKKGPAPSSCPIKASPPRVARDKAAAAERKSAVPPPPGAVESAHPAPAHKSAVPPPPGAVELAHPAPADEDSQVR